MHHSTEEPGKACRVSELKENQGRYRGSTSNFPMENLLNPTLAL